MTEQNSEQRISTSTLREWATEAGFADAGVVPLRYPAEERDADRFKEWVSEGRAGSMQYLERRAEDGSYLRESVITPFPWAKSALVCFTPYGGSAPKSIDPAPEGSGWIARYAWSGRENAQQGRQPSDYHKVLLKRLRRIEERIRQARGEVTLRSFVDTGPVVERSLAGAAGLGWTGKNACLIHPQFGSFGFLSVMFLSLAMEEPRAELPSLVSNQCGSCRRCLDACPTDAFVAPHVMDARRCIAYLTIEHKGSIDEALMPGIGRQVFGCDICQDVCPWNSRAQRLHPQAFHDAEMQTRTELVNPALEWLASLDEAAWERQFNGSPIRRAGYIGFLRNVAIAAGNERRGELRETLQAWAEHEDTGLSAAAQWALGQISLPHKS